MTSLKEIVYGFLNEIKCILREYVHETETAIKKRIQKILIAAIIASILLALAIAFFGAAALFVLVGSLKYLSTFVPAWEAWFVVGIASAIIGALLLLGLFIILRKQLRTSPMKQS